MGPPASSASTNATDVSQSIDANTLVMRLSNVGAFAYNLADTLAEHGLLFPKPSTHGVLFASGLWLGATVGGAPRVTASEYLTELLPGSAAGGIAEPPGASALHDHKLLRTYPSSIVRDAALAITQRRGPARRAGRRACSPTARWRHR
jgi:hypothetical protein